MELRWKHWFPTIFASNAIRPNRCPGGWDAPALQAAREFGDAWLTESRTALLIVPSVVVRAEFNVLVNPAHPDATRIAATEPQPVAWDERLFVVPSVGHS
ncbi:hypothetical protein LMG24235_08431 [Paraburkholderia sabiae]|uniref:RES family NAD+ phosphorylase n=1 Tax=Paraburkholderia sabiae TaxID=273251 RepID=UPI001A049739|nr:hypothetical protein LMG24235_08431 [Paraburkholderia sabiae]